MTDNELDLQAELNRKSGEALAWLSNEWSRGAITNEAYYTSLVMFDMATLGLVDRDFSDWATTTRDVVRMTHNLYGDKAVLRKFNSTEFTITVVELDREKAQVKFTILTPGLMRKKHQEFDTPKEAVDFYNDTLAKAQKNRTHEIMV
jgi:hypothetical protein